MVERACKMVWGLASVGSRGAAPPWSKIQRKEVPWSWQHVVLMRVCKCMKNTLIIFHNFKQSTYIRGVIWGGLGDRRSQGKRKKNKERKKKKKREKRKKRKKERRELLKTSNYYIWSAVFFQFFNSLMALKNKKKFWPPKKKLKWRYWHTCAQM